jgi:uncharacterized protein YyaL (SSP411 family)
MNLLRDEKSPYLLQHAENPVAWQPWGEAAFAQARAEQKPIFLSVGYSTCHWCHVMAHESFEDAATAKILNEHFIPVKVDREERPDVDHVYMTFVQATTGQGGWPMSVWLTPDLKPIYGGTYFPPGDRYGRPGFPALLQRIADLWQTDRATIVAQGEEIVRGLAAATTGRTDGAPAPDAALLDGGYRATLAAFENRFGGFSRAPKFPRPSIFHFLFRYAARAEADAAERKTALGMATFTLDRMAAGGMHDALGGGFHRYSVDETWHVPHFEKMLYDQAQLATAYLEAYQSTGEERHAAAARDILDYVARDLTSPKGGFYSAEDADSLLAANRPEHAEGAFYVWTLAEIEELLGADAALFAAHYGAEREGNAPAGSDPHGEFTGKNILIERRSLAETAAQFALGAEEAATRLARCRAILLEHRNRRPRPHLNDKVISAWNGLMIGAFARAYQILGRPADLQAAVNAASFMQAFLYQPGNGRLARSYRQGVSKVTGFADDYAFAIAGLLDLYEATFEVGWLRQAERLQETLDRLFWDEKDGGYFSTSGEDPSILLRAKEEYDGAEPSANAIAAGNLVRLARLRGNPAFHDRAQQLFLSAKGILHNSPLAAPQLLAAYDSFLSAPQHIVIVGAREGADTRALLAVVHRHYLPHKTLVLLAPDEECGFLGEKAAFFRTLKPIDGQATAYVCEDFACQLPVNRPEDLEKILSGGVIARES